MKKLFTLFAFGFLFYSVSAQDTEVTIESNTGMKVIKGFFTQKDLETDESFYWYAPNRDGFVPDAGAVNSLKAKKDSVNFIVFAGLWCGDTQNILPKFLALTDAAGLSRDRVTLIGVDRSKKTIHHLTEAFHVNLVPTIIVMKNGREIGRVVEYGKYGSFDKELGEILAVGSR